MNACTLFRTAALATVLMLASPLAGGQDLRILTWPGYADPDLVKAFEQRHGVRVAVSFVASDDELWSRISADNGGEFDVFAVNTAELQRYIDSGLAVPIRLANVPNQRRQLDRFRDLRQIPGAIRDDDVYAIPYTYAEMGLIYNQNIVPVAPTSMEAMWDPAYRGKVLAFDASTHNFSIAALLAGARDVFKLDDRDFEQAVDKLIALRRNALTFYSTPEEAVSLFRNNDIALVFGNYGPQQVKQLEAAGADIGYIIPDEGALAWLDCWTISRGVRDATLAEAWINYTLEESVSSALSERQGLANTVNTLATTTSGGKIIWLEPLEDYARRNDLWNRIRAGDSPDSFR